MPAIENKNSANFAGATLAVLATITALLPGASAHAVEFNLVNQHGAPLQHAVVTADSAGATALINASVAQVRQQFLPRVTVVPTGTRMEFPNRDTTLHHVYSFSAAKQFELELYKGVSPDPVPFEKAGIVALGCNIHDWMLGYVYVTDDSYFATSDADGNLSLAVERSAIESLTVWHPAAVNADPQTVAIAALASDGAALRIVITTRANDPLDFEMDPLQALFSEPGE